MRGLLDEGARLEDCAFAANPPSDLVAQVNDLLGRIALAGSSEPEQTSRAQLEQVLSRWSVVSQQPSFRERWGMQPVRVPSLEPYSGPPTARALRLVEDNYLVIEAGEFRAVLENDEQVSGLLVRGRVSDSEDRFPLELDFTMETKVVGCRFVGCVFSRPAQEPGVSPPRDVARFVYTQFIDCSFENLHAESLTASECIFEGTDFSNAHFSGAKFWGSIFHGGKFNHTVFERCSFADSVWHKTRLGRTVSFSGARFESAALRDVQASHSKFASATFDGALFQDGRFDGCRMANTRFNTDLRTVDFSGSKLQGAVFAKGADLTDTKFVGATLTKTNFMEADNLVFADFSRSNWWDADLSNDDREDLGDAYPIAPPVAIDAHRQVGGAG